MASPQTRGERDRLPPAVRVLLSPDRPRTTPTLFWRTTAFSAFFIPDILRRRVILRHPPPSGRVSCWKLRRMMTRFLLFHQTQDTTTKYDG